MGKPVVATLTTLLLSGQLVLAVESGPKVLPERPRIFLRSKAWDGPAVEKLKEFMKLPEYQARAADLPRTMQGNALLWVVGRDRDAGKRALDELLKTDISGKTGAGYTTASVWGDNLQYQSIVYDWLRDHPDFDEAARRIKVKHLEEWGDRAMEYLRKGGEDPFYCRLSAAVTGMTFVGLALHGDSSKADEYVRFAQHFFTEKFGTIREMEDGATGGGTYGMQIEFTHLAHIAAAWRSATDWDAAKWIKDKQGNWLERQMLFQLWSSTPNGWVIKHGDVWDSSHADRLEYRMQIDAITGMYRNGFGRSWADGMHKRWGNGDYYFSYAWEFFVFNDPEVKPRPLEELGRAETFSPRLHGIVCWRDSWKPDATLVNFVCGETVDHHGTYDQGKFMIYKQTPLAIKNGAYIGGYMGVMHSYYKSPWSANCVVFTGPAEKKLFGHQPRDIEIEPAPSWAEWKSKRDQKVNRPPTGVLLATEAKDRFARASGDLTGSCPAGTSWKRELVFLGYKYLLVLDRIKAGPGIKHRWLLHAVNDFRVDGDLTVTDNGPSRLFCKTLLPEKARIANNSGAGKEYLHVTAAGVERTLPNDKWKPSKMKPEVQMGSGRIDVEPDRNDPECVYLHVLFPTDAKTEKMPECSVEKKDADLVVRVGGLEHVFESQK